MQKFNFLNKISSIISLTTAKKLIDFINHYVVELFRRMEKHNLFLAAGGISFSLFLGIIPFILLIFSLLGNIFDQVIIEEQITNLLDKAIPYPAYASYVERIIISRLPQVIELKTSAFWFGVIGLTFTSTWIFSSVRTILNQIFDVKVERGFLYGLLRDIMMVLLLLILVSFATFIIPAVNIIYKLTNNTEFIQKLNISSVWNSIVYVSSLALMFGLFFALYYLIPYEKLGKKVAAMSAFWTTLLWEVARIIFGYYVNNILTTNPFYGAFVLIIAVLFWVYYSACLFIIGAEIGELYRERLALKKVN
ncbi:MAG: YihY/virulence factor BrkB family protein [Ignavibacteriales bacterium]|jgi:membrane protein|nr:YihY/virulence factor BrkB family protein [Ignavibacteriales bacterium]